jgi:aminopeptidase-like protein
VTPLGFDDLRARLALPDPGAAMHGLIRELHPICRSITGDGVRETLKILGCWLPIDVHEVASGTPVLDWVVPREWNVREAWIKGPQGETVVDFRDSNLHVVGYSVPVRAQMTLAELRPHLHTIAEHPDWIPFRSSFYRETWGFCLAQRRLDALADGTYEVCIDATLADGSLSYGEALLPGASSEEILLSAHVCHPSLANDNLSGLALLALLGRYLAAAPRRWSYRFLFAPVTIGAITWLARNEAKLARIRDGLVVTLVGDAGAPTYKQSRRGDARIDRAFAHVLRHAGPHAIEAFSPYGYDERQFCSPGFDLPVGCLMRTPHGRFPEYHSSADDLDFVRPDALADSLARLLDALRVLEGDGRYRNLSPKGEPQLGRRGLYRALADRGADGDREMALLWVLNLSDGNHTLLSIAERSGLRFDAIHEAALLLTEHGLLREIAEGEAA